MNNYLNKILNLKIKLKNFSCKTKKPYINKPNQKIKLKNCNYNNQISKIRFINKRKKLIHFKQRGNRINKS